MCCVLTFVHVHLAALNITKSTQLLDSVLPIGTIGIVSASFLIVDKAECSEWYTTPFLVTGQQGRSRATVFLAYSKLERALRALKLLIIYLGGDLTLKS